MYNRQARSDRYKEDSAKSTEPGSINAATAGGHQPGVAQPGFTWSLSALTDTFGIEGQTLAVGELNPIVSHVTVGPDFFQALGIPLVEGDFGKVAGIALAACTTGEAIRSSVRHAKCWRG